MTMLHLSAMPFTAPVFNPDCTRKFLEVPQGSLGCAFTILVPTRRGLFRIEDHTKRWEFDERDEMNYGGDQRSEESQEAYSLNSAAVLGDSELPYVYNSLG